MDWEKQPESCHWQTLRADTASNFEAEKENEDRTDDGEEESLDPISCDDLLPALWGNILSQADLAH